MTSPQPSEWSTIEQASALLGFKRGATLLRLRASGVATKPGGGRRVLYRTADVEAVAAADPNARRQPSAGQPRRGSAISATEELANSIREYWAQSRYRIRIEIVRVRGGYALKSDLVNGLPKDWRGGPLPPPLKPYESRGVAAERRCIRCRARFQSVGAHHRLCDRCTGADAGGELSVNYWAERDRSK